MNKANTKAFFSYVIPSVLAFALSGVYTIVDGFFIGQSLGDIGIASITLGYPVSALVGAIGTGIGLSGAPSALPFWTRRASPKSGRNASPARRFSCCL